MRWLTTLRRRDQRAVRRESWIRRRKIRVPRQRGFDGVRLIDFLVGIKPVKTQFNFGHFLPCRLRRGRVIVHEPAMVSSTRIVEWHARAFVRFALFMTGRLPTCNTFWVKIADLHLTAAAFAMTDVVFALTNVDFAMTAPFVG